MVCASARQAVSDDVLNAMRGGEVRDAKTAAALEEEVMHLVEIHAGVRLRSWVGTAV
jgi:hypothetical protein